MELSSIRYGDAPVQLILVHGLASNARLWDGVGHELAARGVGALAVDLRGHGQSPKPDDGYDFDSVVGDLLPFLRSDGRSGRVLDGTPLVVGQSYGGNVVIHLAARHPDAVRGVVCVDGGAIDLRQRFPRLDDAVEAMKPPYDRFEGTSPEVMEARLRGSMPDAPETWIRGAMACFDVVDGGVRSRLTWSRHRQIIEAMWHEPTTELFPKVEVPVLFVMASDRMRDGVDAALDALPDGRAVWFDGAHHDVHAQRPAEVAELLLGAL